MCVRVCGVFPTAPDPESAPAALARSRGTNPHRETRLNATAIEIREKAEDELKGHRHTDRHKSCEIKSPGFSGFYPSGPSGLFEVPLTPRPSCGNGTSLMVFYEWL